MAKDPAFLFYSSDFLTGVSTMNFEDRGKYITILALMHQKGRLKEENIRFVVGSISDDLKEKFVVEENGYWYNMRLEQEIKNRRSFVESRQKNGSKGGRKPSGLANGLPLGKASEEPSALPNEDVIENESKERRKKKKIEKEPVEVKIQVAERVSLTKKEFEALKTMHGEQLTEIFIAKLDAYKLSKGAKYDSDYGAINSWVIESVMGKAIAGSYSQAPKKRTSSEMSGEIKIVRNKLIENQKRKEAQNAETATA